MSSTRENKTCSHMKKILFTILAALLLTLLPSFGLKAQAAIRGVDVSEYQGNIDWRAVKNSGVDFAMVRIGNTTYGMDKKFAANMQGAAAAGMRVGCYVYSYALNPTQAAADAQLAIQAMAPFQVSYPVAIDLEDPSQSKLSPAELHAIANTFCSMIAAAGYTPVVYSYFNWFQTKMGVVPWETWVANYSNQIGYPGTIWQYTSEGQVPGILGRVDQNYALKDYAAEIIPAGLTTRAGKTYYYANYRKMVGMQNVAGVNYFFGADGAMVKDQTITDPAGNIIRMKKDGAVVVITAAAQQLAAQAKLASDTAAAALTAAVAAKTTADTELAKALATLEAANLQAAQLIPGSDQVVTLATTQVNNWTLAATQAAADVQTKTLAAAQAKAASDAAAAAIVVPQ